MANSYNTNPIMLDSVMAATAKNSGATYTGRFRITAIHWNSTRAVGTDQCILQDGNGNLLYSEFASTSGFYALHWPIMVDDFKLTRLDDGQLFLYLQNGQ